MLRKIKEKILESPMSKFSALSFLSFLAGALVATGFVFAKEATQLSVFITWVLICLTITLFLSLVCYICVFGASSNKRPIKYIHSFFSSLDYEKKCKLFLFGAVLFTCIFVFSKMSYNGNLFIYWDIGTDTIDLYIPWYTHVINAIREGSLSVFEAEFDLGNNIGAKAGNTNDPFVLFSILLGVIFGSRYISTYLIISRCLLFIISSAVAYRYISIFCKNPLATSIASYVFAYNSFTVIWGQHYMFASYPLYMITLLYFIECALLKEENKCELGLILISFASMIYGVYIVYIIYLPAIFYTVLRYIYITDRFSLSHLLKKAGSMLANVLLGFVGGAIVGISTVSSILSSGRVGGGLGDSIKALFSYLTEWFGWDELIFRLQCFISGNLHGVGSYYEGTVFSYDYYSAPQIFFSVFSVIFALQFIFTLPKISKSKKALIIHIISIMLILCCVLNKGFAYLMYSFSGLAARPVFVILPFVAVMTAIVIDNIFARQTVSRFALLLGLFITEFLILKSYFTLNEANLSAGLVALITVNLILVFAMVYSLLKMSFSPATAVRKASLAFLIFAIIFNVTLETDLSTNRVGAFEKDFIYSRYDMAEDVSEAIKYIESIDPDYYRVEEGFYVFKPIHDSLMIGYNSVSMYEANMKRGLQEFNTYYLDQSNSYHVPWIFPVYTDSMEDIVPYSLLSLKYVLTLETTSFEMPQDNDNYEYIDTVNGIKIYRNKNVNSYTTFYTQAVLKSEYLACSKSERLKLLSKCVVINDEDSAAFSGYLISAKDALASYNETDVTDSSLETKLESNACVSSEDGYILINLNENWGESYYSTFIEFNATSHAGGNYEVYFKTDDGELWDWDNKITLKAETGERKNERIYIPKNSKSILFKFYNGSGEISDFRIFNSNENIIPTENPATITNHSKDSYIEAKVSVDKDGIIFIPTVYDTGWQIKVDGKPTEIYAADSGFMAINVAAGEHEITMEYVSASLQIGSVLLPISVVLTALWFFYPKIKQKIKKKKQKV